MSWYIKKAGHVTKLAETIKEQFTEVRGCPPGSAEEAAKNALGEIAETLCKSMLGDPIVLIEASGSAWHEGDKARQQAATFKFETLSWE